MHIMLSELRDWQIFVNWTSWKVIKVETEVAVAFTFLNRISFKATIKIQIRMKNQSYNLLQLSWMKLFYIWHVFPGHQMENMSSCQSTHKSSVITYLKKICRVSNVTAWLVRGSCKSFWKGLSNHLTSEYHTVPRLNIGK